VEFEHVVDGADEPYGVNGVRRVRRVAFHVVVGLLVLGLAVQWWVVATPLLVWFPDDFVNDFFASRVDDFAIHRIHRLALALSHVIVLVGLAVQFRRPHAREAAMWQVSAFFVMAVVLNLIIGPTSEQVPPPVWIIFGLGVLAGVLHPTSPILRLPKLASTRLLALTVALAGPMMFYVFDHVGLQANGVATDPHWEDSHYQLVAELGLHLILLGIVTASLFSGRRITAWMTGLGAAVMGSASLVFPDQTSGLGIGWGLALACWGLVFIVVSESEIRGNGSSDPSGEDSLPAGQSVT
jgi:hypothetical protein